MRLIVVLAAALMLVGESSSATAGHADGTNVQVAIYRGPASCDDCSEAIASAIARSDRRYRVTFIGPGEQSDVTPANLQRFRVYVQPGGGQDIDGALASLGPSRVTAIRAFVASGGDYLGLCMGAYLADASNIGLVADDLDSEVSRPGFPVRTTADSAIPVQWSGRSQTLYYQDGPFLPPRPADKAYRPIATYQNGDVAAARYSQGKGIVVLSGPHPEADASWFNDADLPSGRLSDGAPFKDLLDQFGA